MKRLLLSTAAFALLLATSCTPTTTEETNVNISDTVKMLPPADNTGPGIEGANPEMVDPNAANMNGDATGGNASGSMAPASNTNNAGSSTSGSNNANNNANANNSNRGRQEVVVPAAPAKDAIKSTYKRAAPGDTVDSRTNMGSSR